MELFREKQKLEQELVVLEKQLPPLPYIHLIRMLVQGRDDVAIVQGQIEQKKKAIKEIEEKMYRIG
jgi:hypothetical protein